MFSTIMPPTVETVETVYHGSMTNDRTPGAAQQPHTERSNTFAQTTAEQLRTQLAAERAVTIVRDEHQLARRTHGAEHRIALDDLGERVANAKRSRRERYRDARDAVALTDLYRRATEAGTRAYIRAQIQGSAEMRALRIASVRKTSLIAGIPVLLAFAIWSTSGVQAGVTRLLLLTSDSFAWAASWTVEPAIITIVALIIIGRAILDSSGGKTDWRATSIEWTGLSLSLALNIVGGWPADAHWEGVVTALPHAIGPIGCAATAFLIGLFEAYVSKATPWEGAPRLASLNLAMTAPNTTNTLAEPANVLPNTTTDVHPAPHTEQSTVANVLPPTAQQAIAPQTNDLEQAEIAEIFRPNTERRTNTARRTTNGSTIDPQLIKQLDTKRPGWRTNIPSARALAELFGYSSSSTGNTIRRRLLVLIEQEDQGDQGDQDETN
jgi:hypothetical protein